MIFPRRKLARRISFLLLTEYRETRDTRPFFTNVNTKFSKRLTIVHVEYRVLCRCNIAKQTLLAISSNDVTPASEKEILKIILLFHIIPDRASRSGHILRPIESESFPSKVLFKRHSKQTTRFTLTYICTYVRIYACSCYIITSITRLFSFSLKIDFTMFRDYFSSKRYVATVQIENCQTLKCGITA